MAAAGARTGVLYNGQQNRVEHIIRMWTQIEAYAHLYVNSGLWVLKPIQHTLLANEQMCVVPRGRRKVGRKPKRYSPYLEYHMHPSPFFISFEGSK